jgi:hypothetical protein
MRQRPGILRRISSFMPYSLRPGNSITISRPTSGGDLLPFEGHPPQFQRHRQHRCDALKISQIKLRAKIILFETFSSSKLDQP